MTGLAGVGLYAMRREQVAGVLAACRRADRRARAVAAALEAVGLGAAVRQVAGVVDGAGEAVVCVTLTLDGARRLARLLASTPGLLLDEVMHPPHERGSPHGSSEAA